MLIGYARVSTRDQDPALQLRSLAEVGCERVFEERASGAQRDRPELLRALDIARKGDIIVVWKLDRLARSLKQLIETVESLGERGVGFKSVTENIDTTTPGGKLVFHLFGALAEFERGIIRERTMAGLDAARANGTTLGAKPKLTAKDLAAAKAMLAGGELTVAEVAEKLGVSRPTLYRYIPKARTDGDLLGSGK